MENIFETNGNFDFNNISLAHPGGISGGAYFTKIQMNNKPLYIETPKCLTKQGFVKNGKKLYSDLMFDNNDEQFIRWMENLETKCQQLIYEKGESWFQNQLEMNDIETAFTSPMRIYKSGKFYLIRVNVKMNYITNTPQLKIYNESEIPLSIDDVVTETNIISIVEVQGIKFTSRNFQIELELKQVMVITTNEIFENCLIKTNTNNNTTTKINKIPTDNTFISNKLDFKIIPPTPSSAVALKHGNMIDDLNEYDYEEPTDLERSEAEGDGERLESVDGSRRILDKKTLLEKISQTIINEGVDNNYVDINDNDNNDNDNNNDNNNDGKTINIVSDISLTTDIKTLSETQPIEKKEVMLDITEIDITDNVDNQNDLKEINIFPNFDSLETITLKKPNQVYYEIYKEARKKAKAAKKLAIIAFLEAKNIKKTYMLDDLDESDNDSYNDSDEDNDEDDVDISDINNSDVDNSDIDDNDSNSNSNSNFEQSENR